MAEMQIERVNVHEESSALNSLHGEQTLSSEAYRGHLVLAVLADIVAKRR
jgi:hypothetical protein